MAPAEFEVDVVRVGRSSVEFAVRLHQGGRPVVDVQLVLARVTGGRTASTPLSDRQRAALEAVCIPVAAAAD